MAIECDHTGPVLVPEINLRLLPILLLLLLGLLLQQALVVRGILLLTLHVAASTYQVRPQVGYASDHIRCVFYL